MNYNLKIIFSTTLFLLITQKVCFAAEPPSDYQKASRHSNITITPKTTHTENYSYIWLQNIPYDVKIINNNLHEKYGSHIQLSPKDYAEILSISEKKYELEGMLCGAEMDQVTLVWNTGSWGILMPKRKYKTFDLEQRPVATVDVSLHVQAHSPVSRPEMVVLPIVSSTTPTVLEVSNQYNNQLQQFKPPFTTDEITSPTYLPQTPAQRQTDKHSSQRRYAKAYPDMDKQQAINAYFEYIDNILIFVIRLPLNLIH